MKRVLIVNTVYTTFNGITSVILNYVRKTHEKIKYDFVLCSYVDESVADKLKQMGGNVFIPPYSRLKEPISYSSWLRKIMKEHKYDVIHVHGNSGTLYFEIHAAKKEGIPTRIAHAHSTSCRFMLAHRFLKPLLNREMTHGLACSDLAGRWLFTRGYTVLPNGIDVEQFSFSQAVRDNYRKQLNLENKLVIGHAGYLNAEKNQLFLLRVMEQLVKQQPNARLLLIGEGTMRSEIEVFIQEHQLQDCVQLLGRRSDIAQLYQCMDVFVLPSVYEGLGIVLIEAQASGLQCVASTGVPQVANALGQVEYVGIEDTDIDQWCSAIIRKSHCVLKRAECYERMQQTQFNINLCVDILMKAYQM